MKIMKVVYSAESQNSKWSSALRMYEEYTYMGEESWSVGEKFNGEFIQGIVTEIFYGRMTGAQINVDGEEALFIPLHAVQRIYYGEE